MGTLFAKSPVSNEMKKVNPFITAKGFKEGTYFQTTVVSAGSGVSFKVKSRQRISLNCAFYEIYDLNENNYFVCSENPIRYISGSLKIGVFYKYGTFHEIGESVSLNTSGAMGFYLKASSTRDIKEGSMLIIQDNQNKYYLVCFGYNAINYTVSISTTTIGFETVEGIVRYESSPLLNINTNFIPLGNKTNFILSYPVFVIQRNSITSSYKYEAGITIQ